MEHESQNHFANMSDLTSDSEKKKELLQTEIINKNYNKEQFIDYCSSKKSYGDDLTRWAYPELKAVVDEFAKYHEEEKKNQERQKLMIDSQQQQKMIMLDVSKLTLESIQPNKQSEYTKEIECKKLEPSILSNQAISIQVRNPKGIETGMFQANYITYDVITNQTNWLVRRRYSDFEWLRIALKKYHPRLFIPPLPNKKIGSRRFEPDFVEKRMMLLEKFINKIVENESLKASECVIAFLSITDRTQYECRIKELNTFVPSAFIEDVRTINGKLTLLEDNYNDIYYSSISNYLKLQTQLFDHLVQNLRSYNYNMNAACQNLEQVKNDFEILQSLNSRIGMRKKICSTYSDLGVFFKNWKRIMFNEKELIREHIKDFFKYVRMEGVAYQELITSREELKNQYINDYERLLTKKDKLWATMDLTKWEIIDDSHKIDRILLMRDKSYATAKMCTMETQFVENLRKQLDYAHAMNQEELRKMLEGYSFSYKSNLKQFIEALYPSLNDGLNVWSQLRSNFD